MTRPGLDPRTISPEALIQRIGDRRPDITLLVPTGAKDTAGVPEAATLHEGLPGIRLQILFQNAGPATATTTQWNALAHRALAPVLVLLPLSASSIPELRAALDQLRDDPRCGSIPLGRLGDGICTRSAIWRAFRGLDEELSFPIALKDFHERQRNIGLDVPVGPSQGGTGARPGGLTIPKLVIYTAVTGGYDTLKPLPLSVLDGCTAIAFVDRASRPTNSDQHLGWTIVETVFEGRDAARRSRFPKINAHLALPDAEVSLWIDASIGICCPYRLLDMVGLFLREADICVFHHHARGSVAEEALACKAYGLDSGAVIDDQLMRYAEAGFADIWGLAELPVLLRRHSPEIASLNEAWWAELESGSRRDQLSFPYVAWRERLNCAFFPRTLQDRNGLFVKYLRLP